LLATKQLAEEVSEEEGMHIRANTLVVGPGKETGGWMVKAGGGDAAATSFSSWSVLCFCSMHAMPQY